ncbi:MULTISPECIES: hypothetical protein [unclassified Streptomyces]|uniref:hypothetical protein n=1 Tax=unclassified Streptomyces TaxID=2593676 RepID=UPI002E2B6627|nr:hypothetical protein [Streptomyces sp. NBC_00228]
MTTPGETAEEPIDRYTDRLMRLAVRRIGEQRNATSPIDRLSLAAELRAAAELRVKKEIGRCRRASLSWAEIGAALGVSAQAAHQRYKNASAPLDPEDLLDLTFRTEGEDDGVRDADPNL